MLTPITSRVHPNPFPARNWLLPVAPPTEHVTPEIGRFFQDAAEAALAGDLLARDALFAAFLPRSERSIRRVQRLWSEQIREAAIEPEDIAQEAYLVFVDLLDCWSPDEPIAAHLSGQFYWRLNDAMRIWRKPSPVRLAALAVVPADDHVLDVETRALVDEVTANLAPEITQMLLWRVSERLTFPQMAKRAGVSTRTVRRRWDQLVLELARGGLLESPIG
jgi:DNA-directed RNA polymerase specialized sigma24 family protein